MSVRLAGFREPGLRKVGAVSTGGTGGSTDAVDITITDAGGFYTSGNVEGALQEAYTAINLRAKSADLASTAAGKGASLIGTNDPSLLILGLHPTVEASLVSIAADVDTALGLLNPVPLANGGTGQITAAASFDALTVTAPSIASAATVDLSLAGCPGHYVIITGNTGPITSFGTAPAGTERILRFASNPTVHHDAAALILPGGADITMAAGDLLFLHSLGSGNWRATSYTRAASLPAYANDLASTTAGKGASTIGLQDAGGYFVTKNVEAALQQLGAASGTATSLTATLSDAGTNTAPDLINVAHRSSGTPAANFGLTVARELDSSAKTRRRAIAEVTKWTTATDGAETASHTFQLRLAGTLTDTLSLSPTTSNFPVNGSAAVPTLTVGTAGDLIGFYRSSSQELGIAAGGTRLGRWFTGSPGGLLADTIFMGPVSSAANPTFTVNGSTGGSGLYGATDQVLAAITGTNVLTMSKQLGAFKYTAPNPTANFTASTEVVGFDVAMGRTATWSTGAITTQREVLFRKPTYAFAGASTVTTTATVAIEGAPVAGTNATLTNPYSLWTQAGLVRFDSSDAATSTATDTLVLRHVTSGTPAAGLGVTTVYELPSSTGTNRRAVTDVVSWQVATDGAEYGQREWFALGAGASSSILKVSWSAPNVIFTVNNNGLNSGAGLLNLHVGGTSFLSCNSAFGVSVPFRFEQNRGASVAAATTITLGTGGNTFPISVGTGTINSIVATSWQAGSRIILECASGITITHNVAGTGATILTNTGASIVTSSTRAIPLVYNGTNWIVEG